MNDSVNHPSHYKEIAKCPNCDLDIEAIITEKYNFNPGNTLKYILRDGKKKSSEKTIEDKELEDLKKSTLVSRL